MYAVRSSCDELPHLSYLKSSCYLRIIGSLLENNGQLFQEIRNRILGNNLRIIGSGLFGKATNVSHKSLAIQYYAHR